MKILYLESNIFWRDEDLRDSYARFILYIPFVYKKKKILYLVVE